MIGGILLLIASVALAAIAVWRLWGKRPWFLAGILVGVAVFDGTSFWSDTGYRGMSVPWSIVGPDLVIAIVVAALLLFGDYQLDATADAPAARIAHAYPLQQITIRLQGTRHSSREAIVAQLDIVAARLRAGDATGEESDDDFGYAFDVKEAASGPSFFAAECSKR